MPRSSILRVRSTAFDEAHDQTFIGREWRTRDIHPVFYFADEVMRMSGRLAGLFSEITAQSGLSRLGYAVFIYVAESQTPPTVPLIGRSLGYARQVIQRAVNELVQIGFLETRSNPNHKRAPLLAVTESGVAFKKQSDARVNTLTKALQRYVSDEQFRTALNDLHELRVQIENYARDQAQSKSAAKPKKTSVQAPVRSRAKKAGAKRTRAAD